MPNTTTTTNRSRRLTAALIAACFLALVGAGCNGFKAGEPASPWTREQQDVIDSWPTTTEKMLKLLRTDTEFVSRYQPDRIVVSQIALAKDVPASDVINWFKQFPQSSFITFYLAAGKIGGGFYNFRPETPAKDVALQDFKDMQAESLASAKVHLERWKMRCSVDPLDTLCPLQLPREQETYNAELGRQEKYVYGLDIRGPARDLGVLINDPRVYSVNIESGDRPVGIPFFPGIEEVHSWLP